MQQLTLVVPCTDRKKLAPKPELTARTLSAGSAVDRCEQWLRRLSTSPSSRVPLKTLYKGDAWQQALRLGDVASENWRVQTLVASAGLGLQLLEAEHPSYAVTFTSGHADTACDTSDSGKWWQGLRAAPQAESLTSVKGAVLAVLSTAYARALHEDLLVLGQRYDTELLVIGGWKDIPGALRVPADRDLRKALGGTVGTLLPRMAQQWLAMNERRALTSLTTLKQWRQWAESSRDKESFDRKPLTDAEVWEFIHHLRDSQPTVSATGALRILRDSGFACEQKRFGRLFRECQEAA